MDAVELHLPTSVVVSKLLQSQVFGRVGESEACGSAGGSSAIDATISGTRKASSSCGSFKRDVYPITTSEQDSVSKNKKNDGAHGGFPSSFKNDQLTLEQADNPLGPFPKHDSKQLHRKSIKGPNSSLSSKRMRTNQPESSMNSYITKCTSVEKSRVAKQKRGQESKRSDKKNFRTSAKTKFDSVFSKNGLVNSDAVATGSNAFGISGIKSDLHDITKSVDELCLSELLDGSYKYPNLGPDKGKKTANPNGSILLSVKKACSILLLHSAVGSSGNRKVPSGILSSTIRDEEHKSNEESVLSSQIQDSAQATLTDSPLYQPKDVLEQLALPVARDLDSLLLDFNMPLDPSQKITGIATASLPPFPWSSHNGSCKPNSDSGKSATNKNTCQGRWVRIGSSWRFVGDDRSCFPELDLKIHDCTRDLSRQNFDDHSQDVKTLAVDGKLPSDGHVGMSCALTGALKTHMPDILINNLNFMAMNVDSSVSHSKFGLDDSVAYRNVEAEGGLQHQGNEPNSLNPSSLNLEVQRAAMADEVQARTDMHSVISSNGYYPCKSCVGRCEQCSWHSPTSGVSSSVYSPRLFAAAEILCDIARHSDVTWKGNHSNGKFRLPHTPSQMAMKARKTRPSMGKVDGLIMSLAESKCEPVKSTSRVQSPQPKLTMGVSKSKISMNSVSRGPVRWSDPIQNIFSGKLESHLAVNTKYLHGSSVRLVGQTPSPTRAGRVTDGHHKHRRGIVTSSSVRNEGIYVKDWGRIRSKRE